MAEAEGSEQQPETASQASAVTYSLNLLQAVRTAQAQNGIKHGDYMRYRWAGLPSPPLQCTQHACAYT